MKCLIVDKMHDDTCHMLENIGLSVDYRPDISRDEIKKIISSYEGLIIRSKTPLDKELIDQAIKLKFVGRAGAGVDNLDVEYLKLKGIDILNAPEGNRNALGEHALGLLLALFNNITKSDRQVRNMIWDREGNRGMEIKGKTISLIGYGNMGGAFAKKLSSFDCQVLAHDKYKTNYGDKYAKEADLQEVFDKSDVLSLHVPLTSETNQMVNKNFLSKFKKPIYILNTSRGEVVPFSSYVDGFKSGKIIGAGIDVLENEKLETLNQHQKDAFEFLLKQDNVIFTPHVGGWSYESYRKISEVLSVKISEYLNKNNTL